VSLERALSFPLRVSELIKHWAFLATEDAVLFSFPSAFHFDIQQRFPTSGVKIIAVVNYDDIPTAFDYCDYISAACTLMELNSETAWQDQSSRTSFELQVILVNSNPLWSFLALVYVLIPEIGNATILRRIHALLRIFLRRFSRVKRISPFNTLFAADCRCRAAEH
jgi:hypothetical protein